MCLPCEEEESRLTNDTLRWRSKRCFIFRHAFRKYFALVILRRTHYLSLSLSLSLEERIVERILTADGIQAIFFLSLGLRLLVTSERQQ